MLTASPCPLVMVRPTAQWFSFAVDHSLCSGFLVGSFLIGCASQFQDGKGEEVVMACLTLVFRHFSD